MEVGWLAGLAVGNIKGTNDGNGIMKGIISKDAEGAERRIGLSAMIQSRRVPHFLLTHSAFTGAGG